MTKLWLPPGTYREIEACGLDVDGVLRDSGYHSYVALCKTVEQLGGKIPQHQDFIADFWHRAEFAQKCGVDAESSVIEQVYDEHHQPHNLREPFWDALAFCDNMRSKRDLSLFAISGCPTEWVVEWFERHELKSHFKHVISNVDSKEQHIEFVCNQLGIDPAKTCFVGDLGEDMRGAVKAGVIPVGLTRGHNSAEAALKKHGAKLVVSHLDQLTCLIS